MRHDMVRVRGGAPDRYRAPQMRLGRSQFDLSHNHKTTFDAGRLVPYLVEMVTPGDTYTCRLHSFVRVFSPLEAPIMDNIHIGIDFFFVPMRLLWDNWEYFLGAHDDAGAQDTDFTIPILSDATTPVEIHSLAHYMGIPLGLQFSVTDVSALPFRAYELIYNEWYRDQNIIDSLTIDTGNGPDSTVYGDTDTYVRISAKRPDYFTTALPYLQKGTAIQYAADVVGDPAGTTSIGSPYFMAGDSTPAGGGQLLAESTGDPVVVRVDGGFSASEYLHWADPELVANIDINGLRESVAIQRLLERDARGGTRHPELIRAHFGVDVPDFRTQRPEYIGGGSGFVNSSPVANTSATATEDQGELRGIGTGELSASWAQSFVEHGYIIGLLRARGEVSYQQGLDRHWSKSTRYDFLWPELANLGEQPIYNKELFVQNLGADDNVFGYQERYAEYRYKKSLVTGKFASDASGSLDFWHLSEDFASAPSLNQTFIEDATPMSRVTTVTTEPDFIIDGRFDLRVARALPVAPLPSLVPARF